MEKEKIEKLYKLVIDGYVLNNHILLQEEFTQEEVEYLILKRIISPTEEGKYEIFDAEKFHKYGIKLLQEHKVREANICFKMCYKINPKDRRINLQLLLAAIKRNDYEAFLEVYKNLESISYGNQKLDNNLYLYLLNLITELPEEYTDRIRDFKYEDIIFTKCSCNKDENKVRIAIYRDKFLYACKVLNDLMMKREEYSVKYELLRALISKTIDAEKQFKYQLLELVNKEDYEEIIKILTNRSNIKKLNKVETYLLLITYAITKLLETKQLPTKTVNISYDMYEAIMGNNFDLALELNIDHHILTKTNKEEDPIYILLVKITNLIKSLQSEPIEPKITIEETELDKEIITSEELAYYITSENIPLSEAIKKLGIRKEQALMIRLIYIRDYYIEGNNLLADNLLKEIKEKEELTPLIISFINKIKEYKVKNESRTNTQIKKRIK